MASPAFQSPPMTYPPIIPEWYIENNFAFERLIREIVHLTIRYKSITPYHYQLLIDYDNWIWANIDFTNIHYPFEPPQIYVIRDGKRWDVTKIDWLPTYNLRDLITDAKFNILQSPSGMMGTIRKKCMWGMFRCAPMLMLWRKRATERLYHPSRIDFRKIMEED